MNVLPINDVIYKNLTGNYNNLISFKYKQRCPQANKADISFRSGDVNQNELAVVLPMYMQGLKSQIIEILKKDNILNRDDIEKISRAFDEEIAAEDSVTRKHILEDIEYIKSVSKNVEGSNDPRMLLAQDTVPVRFYYEVAHKLYTNGEKALGMQVAKKSTQITGAQVYPGANIKSPFYLSHSIGTVIGNTAYIGPYTRVYQCVTVGSTLKSGNQTQRHPRIEGYSIIGANSTLLGNITVAKGAIVGAASIVTHDVPSGNVVRSLPSINYPKKGD